MTDKIEKKETIVLIDDDISNLTICKKALGDTYNVITFDSGERFFMILPNINPSLILLDVEMPDMGGYEVIRKLKNIPKMAQVPVVFLTSHRNEEAEIKGFDLGAADYIIKPISALRLKKRVEVCLLVRQVKDAMAERKFNKHIKYMLDSAPMSVMLYDTNRKVINCNEEAVRLFGLGDKENFIKQFNERYYDFFPPYQHCGTPTKEKSDMVFHALMTHGKVTLEWTHLTAKGEIFPADVTLVRVGYGDAQTGVVYIRDLREEKKAEAKRLEDNEWINTLFEMSPLCVEVWEPDGDVFKLTDCNNQALGLFGIPNKREYLENHYRFTPEFQPCGMSSKDMMTQALRDIMKKGQGKFEYMHITASGDELPIEFTFVRLHRSGKSVLVGYAYDLRQIKTIEKQRLEIAEEKNMVKSKFLARMSHEIRTPISAVLGISEIELQNPELPPRLEEAFAKIHNSSNMLLNIVNDILDLSKIEAGKMEIIQVEYETSSMISDAAHMQSAFLGSKNIEFIMQIDENLPFMLYGDVLRIEQILYNLLSNAFKYTEKGTVTLSMHWADRELVVSICDTGVGMSSEQLDILGDDFTRFHEREIGIGGTGLGMSIVSNLVSLMGAKMDVKSNLGIGTEVIVRIPQETVDSRVIGKDLSARLQQFEMFISTSSKLNFEPEPMPYGKVLVVDDMEANLYVARGLLGFYDLVIETCTNGHDTIQKIKDGNTYDIVFLDQMMPEISGNETLAIMRELNYQGPIVALTANALIGQAEEFIKNGFDGFISKPIQTTHLNTILIKYIRDLQPQEVIDQARAEKGKTSSQLSINDYQSDANIVSKLRIDYVKNHRNAVAELLAALNVGDISTAHRIAHNLKGLAGLMQEPLLAETAAQVEYVLKDEILPIDKLLSRLEQEHNNVIESIGIPDAKTKSVPLNKEKAKTLFDNLIPLLTAQEVTATDYLDELRTLPESAVLANLIENYEFRIALKCANELKKILNF
ncbi:MAG: response regulator [Defluviitaleaceae bacterium]|nr:response regulator [Defluviitaleaceae bacterium]